MEIKYNRARFSARILALLADLIIMLIFGLIIVVSIHPALQNASFYKNARNDLNDIQLESGLYKEKPTTHEVVSLLEFYDANKEDDLPFINNEIENALSSFYSNPLFFEDVNDGTRHYVELKLKSGCFIYSDDSHTDIVRSLEATDKDVYKFYYNVISEDAILCMSRNSTYINAIRTLNWSLILLDILMPIVVSVTIFEFIIPLIFKRGRKTLGKLMFRIGLIDQRGLSVTFKRFLVRFLFILFVEVLLSLVTFLVPIVVSFSMYFFSKNKQPFHDYMVGTHLVDLDGKRIYFTKEEYIEAKNKSNQFQLKKEDINYE